MVIFKTLIYGTLKVVTAVRNIETLMKIACLHLAVPTGPTLYQDQQRAMSNHRTLSPITTAFPHMAHYVT